MFLLTLLISLTVAKADSAKSPSACRTLRIGNDHLIAHKFMLDSDWVQYVKFSANSKGIMFGSRHSANFYNVETGQKSAYLLPLERDIELSEFSADGKTAYLLEMSGTLIVKDLVTGTEVTRKVRPVTYSNMARFSPDRKKLIYSSSVPGPGKFGRANEHLFVYDLETGIEREFEHWGYIADISADSNRVVVITQDKSLRYELHIRDLKSGVESKVKLNDSSESLHLSSARFSPAGTHIAIFRGSNEPLKLQLIIKDLRNGTEFKRDVNPDLQKIEYSSDGRFLYLTSKNGIVLYDIAKRGAPLKLPVTGDASEKKSNLEVKSPDGMTEVEAGRNAIFVKSHETVCMPDSMKVDDDDCCTNEKKPSQLISAALERSLGKLVHSQLCKEQFSNRDWEKETPYPSPNPIPRDMAERYLMRFQKPGGFNIERHLPILLAILNSSVAAAHPDSIAAVFQNVLLVSNNLFEDLSAMFADKFQFNKKLKLKKSEMPQLCRSEKDLAALRSKAVKHANFMVKRATRLSGRNMTTTERTSMWTLQPLLFQMDAKDQSEASQAYVQTLCSQDFRCPDRAYPDRN